MIKKIFIEINNSTVNKEYKSEMFKIFAFFIFGDTLRFSIFFIMISVFIYWIGFSALLDYSAILYLDFPLDRWGNSPINVVRYFDKNNLEKENNYIA